MEPVVVIEMTEKYTPPSTDDRSPRTKANQPIAIHENLTTGSKQWGQLEKDKHIYEFQPTLPSQSKARTTFYGREADDTEQFDKLFNLQHNRQHPDSREFENWSESWKYRVRQADVFKYRRACTLLSQANVTGIAREQVLHRVMTENLNGFSRYYAGIDGATLGFASIFVFDKKDDVKESVIFETAEATPDINAEKLFNYVWRKYRRTDR
jgi:hypothetical protein